MVKPTLGAWWRRERRTALLLALVVVFVVALISLGAAVWVAMAVLPPALVQAQLQPHVQISDADRIKAINDVRASVLGPLAALVGASAVLVGAGVAYLDFKGTLELNRRGQVTDRFTKAIEQLGDDKLEVRVGGVYALEQTALDSKELHWAVMEVLTAFVRDNSVRSHRPTPQDSVRGSDEERLDTGSQLQTDLQAALTVVGRRPETRRREEKESNRQLDLRSANLPTVNLYSANLEGARLTDTQLSEANLSNANLQLALLDRAQLQKTLLQRANLQGARLVGASLSGARLNAANLIGADLREANLMGADLQEANVSTANLQGTHLFRADLRGANLSGSHLGGAIIRMAILSDVDLSHTHGLTQEQLDSAACDETTTPAPGLTIKPRPRPKSAVKTNREGPTMH